MTAQIAFLGDPATHFWLTRSMARTLGVSLSEAMACDALSATDYAEMVTRCRSCPYVEDCQSWLSEGCTKSAQAPGFCCHADVLQALTKIV
ncbi:DUF6455 family protein [Shimia sp. Alg240-R146]|uniref:DUF6455 family protein n=1 Tax=Shimia sp. Alg240-R146 TaxID=2993449 RepID=UPI0022E2858F|nr:DUF6455 family protein [Shimia sp. Alg240-R146]